jgi:hypothetical protein
MLHVRPVVSTTANKMVPSRFARRASSVYVGSVFVISTGARIRLLEKVRRDQRPAIPGTHGARSEVILRLATYAISEVRSRIPGTLSWMRSSRASWVMRVSSDGYGQVANKAKMERYLLLRDIPVSRQKRMRVTHAASSQGIAMVEPSQARARRQSLTGIPDRFRPPLRCILI